MKTRSWLRTKLSQASTKRSGCLLLSKQTKHKQKQKHKVSTPKVPSQRRSTHLEPNFHTEGFELDPPATSQLHQPASARGQAPKRPAPETPASTASEGPPSGPLSPAHPSQSSARSSDPPLTAYSGSSRTPVGAHPAHPYQRAPSPATKGKGSDTGKGKGSGSSYADIAGKGKKGQQGQKGQKVPKGKNPKGHKGQKGQKGEGGKGSAKGDTK